MSKPWGGGIGAWAEEAELEPQSFPSLKEAAAAKPKKKKTPMPISQFISGTYVGPGGARRDSSMESKGLTTDEMLRLPTGPKERSAEEMEYGRLGGGFKSYGTRSGPPGGRMRDRGDDSEGSWGGGGGGGGRRSYGGFDDERRAPQPRASEYDQPSRADEVDNWAMGKKPLPSMDSGRHDLSGRNDRYSSLGGGSRADEVDNWAVGKKPLPARTTSFGSGFRDSTGPEPDRWSRGGPPPPPRDVDRSERPRIVLDPPRVEGSLNEPAKLTRPSPFAAARPREEVLAAKGLDWRKLDSEIETKKTSRPTSAHSSRPTSSHSSRPQSPATQVVEVAPKPRPKVNPFGDAKPREVLLQEQGKDWRKMDFELEHRGVDRPETDEEKMLKEEINNLKKELEKEDAINVNGESLDGGSGADKTSLHEIIQSREKDLELLIRELDDKVRFGQKAATERPGSGAGRVIGYPERPPSQSGRSEDSRNMEFMDRPRSRGTGDVWTRPVDDRRAFQGGRERGFLGNRDMDRSRGGERW
ncbi:Plant specific eukaryotic initiation factor 4B [Macleaya cordata]|uniref:Plant specific eukaryotic initiation factor 4B n=1 Tax=Macleaya cordata TaxID=56857 RepID=A0A200RD01_MACCD|nr:Plant specific eukaryotic initiation factor 4B [Macleaya cordata]